MNNHNRAREAPYVLAVDGGNTKTIALVATLDGTIVGAGRDGCSDIYNAPPRGDQPNAAAAARANAERAVLAALEAGQIVPSAVGVSVWNMAGVDWPEDVAFWHEVASEHQWGRRLVVQNDALGVLYAATPDATGVSVVCGTGAATGARAADGRTWHSSFWQDEVQGSMHLGQKLLFAVYRSALGLEPPTSLTARVLESLGAETVEEVLHLFHNRRRPAPIRVDRLTSILLDEAAAGDGVALEVVCQHGVALGDIAMVAARQVDLERSAFHLVLAGGVFRHPTTVLEDAIIARVRTSAPDVRPIRTPAEPIIGVLLQALMLAGVAIDDGQRQRTIANLPAELITPSIALFP